MPQPEYVQPPLFPEFSSSPSEDALPEDAVLAEEELAKAKPGDVYISDACSGAQLENVEPDVLEPDVLEPDNLESDDSDPDDLESDDLESNEALNELSNELPIEDLLDESVLNESILDEPLDERVNEPSGQSQLYEPLDQSANKLLADHYSDPDWLDESSLKTILDMLAVIDSVEELAMLEALTPLQKRQVWDVTPDSIQLRLKELRSVNAVRSTWVQLGSSGISEGIEDLEDLKDLEELADLANLADVEGTRVTEESHLALFESHFLNEMPFPNEMPFHGGMNASTTDDFDTGYPLSSQPILAKGARVVLKAKPKLTAAELTAIWTVIDVHEGYARIQTKGMTRNYPIAWMVLYPKLALEEES